MPVAAVLGEGLGEAFAFSIGLFVARIFRAFAIAPTGFIGMAETRDRKSPSFVGAIAFGQSILATNQ